MGHSSGLQVRFESVSCVSFWAHGYLGYVLLMAMTETPEAKPSMQAHFTSLLSSYPLSTSISLPKASPKSVEQGIYFFSLLVSPDGSHGREKV